MVVNSLISMPSTKRSPALAISSRLRTPLCRLLAVSIVFVLAMVIEKQGTSRNFVPISTATMQRVFGADNQLTYEVDVNDQWTCNDSQNPEPGWGIDGSKCGDNEGGGDARRSRRMLPDAPPACYMCANNMVFFGIIDNNKSDAGAQENNYACGNLQTGFCEEVDGEIECNATQRMTACANVEQDTTQN